MQNPHFGSKLKFQKTCQNLFWKAFRVVLCKNRSKKHSIFEKWDHFKNWLLSKGYSPCKNLILGQKLKFQKTWQNAFYKPLRVVLSKKPLQKTLNIREMRQFWKLVIMQGYSPCKILSLGQKLEFQKHVKIHSTNHLELFCAKNRSKKH